MGDLLLRWDGRRDWGRERARLCVGIEGYSNDRRELKADVTACALTACSH